MDNSKWLNYLKREVAKKSVRIRKINQNSWPFFTQEGVTLDIYSSNECILKCVKNGMVHNEKGPAIIEFERDSRSRPSSILNLWFYLKDENVTEEEWVIKTTKLGKILYG
jgi:hypothetical protein